MTKLHVAVGASGIKRQRFPVSELCLRQLVGLTQLAGFFQRVPVLNPNRGVTGISVESLPVEPSGTFPLPCSPGAIGEGDEARPQAPQTKARPINNAGQCHFTLD